MRWPVRRDGFDPRKQSWLAGAIAALEACAGAVLALMATFGTIVTTSILFEGSLRHHHYRQSAVHSLLMSLGLGALGIGFLWSGVSLMFGWKTTWRSQAVPVATLLVVVIYVAFARVR